jgi:uncharacterized protein YgiM (DUF1202 family)
MGFRFQKRISILPGVRVNLSKSGASASIGPKGADVNIGPHGVTTNAGIPGTGMSYRSKLGTHGSWLGVALLVGALAFWAGRHMEQWTGALPSQPVPVVAATHATAPTAERPHLPRQERIAALQPGTVYVRRGGSVVRDDAKSSATVLKREAKGTAVTLLEKTDDGWARVKDGAITGWMRASVLGAEAP